MATCSKCSAEEIENYSHAKCDACEKLMCINCSGLTASELRGVTVKKRSPGITFYCPTCCKSKNENNSTQELKNVMTKLLQRGFDELKSSLTNRILNVFKAENIPITSQLKEMDTSFKNLISTNKEVIHLYSNMNTKTKPHLEIPETQELLQFKESQALLMNKCSALEAEIIILKEEISKLQLSQIKSNAKEFKSKSLTPANIDQPRTASPVVKQPSDRQMVKQPATTSTPTPFVAGRSNDATQPRTKNFKLVAANYVPKCSVFVSRLDTSTTKDDLMEHLKSTFGDSPHYCITPQQVMSGDYSSFKIDVDRALQGRILDGENWPAGITVKKYQFFQRGQGKGFAQQRRGMQRRY